MPFSDLLLYIDSYPDPTPAAAIDQAVALASRLKGRLTALAVRAKIPLKSNRFLDLMSGLSGMIGEEEARSRDACRVAIEHFTETAKAAGVLGETLTEPADLFGFPEHVARRARTRDFCILPLAARHDGEQAVAREVIFGSGRPVLLFLDSMTAPLCADRIADQQAAPARLHGRSSGAIPVAFFANHSVYTGIRAARYDFVS